MAPAQAWPRGLRGLRACVVVAVTGVALLGAAAGACYDFTYPTGSAEDASSPEAGRHGNSRACIVGVLSCGDDDLVGAADMLYRCASDGGGELVKRCASGCARDAGPGEDARCNPPAAPCKAGGNYCGGDRLDGDPRVLYRCVSSGAHTIVERCAKGCRIMPIGTDDECAR